VSVLPLLLAVVSLVVWVVLTFFRSAFWQLRAFEDEQLRPSVPEKWPAVVAVVPARNEAESIERVISSLVGQEYGGPFQIIVVDDHSEDGTGALARRAARASARSSRIALVTAETLESGWTGKLWALEQGIERAQGGSPDYYLLSDADIVYAPDVLGSLVARAQADGLVLVSLMVKLRCESIAERALVPAFIFFFEMLYPFAWINRREAATAGAAGGCMLVRADALHRIGGIECICDALIDDCTLAAELKRIGPIRLSLTERAHSIRRYPGFQDIRRMVARSAYAQLHYSPLILLGVVAGMGLTYLAPPLFALAGVGWARLAGLAAWLLMALAFQPTLRFYRVSPLWGIALPAIAFCYTLFTLDSALQYARGQGGLWKGRVQARE